MTLRTWLILFICSMAVSAEVIHWAYRNGQFSSVNRGRALALRAPGHDIGVPPRRRPWALAIFALSLLAAFLAWLDGMGILIHEGFGH